MLFNVTILFLTALLAGMAVFFIPRFDQSRFKVALSFSGAYLFSITVIHIIPELFQEAPDIRHAGIFVLVGFFMQMILEFFTTGVEHGHLHHHNHAPGHTAHVPYAIFASLFVHAFLEGTLLVHPSHNHGHDDGNTLLYGLVIHKIPEAFALMFVLLFRLRSKTKAFVLLVLFALASPAGLLVSDVLHHGNFISENVFIMLFAIVAGNFLYISTTIFFENSPEHKFKASKLSVSLLGAAMAILAEYML
ncbi:ZIP family metal transporter [Cytophagaceae bacterium ABcell3]|nr:ZIP family metal transporter [Cytophagaceae bacterium ABcell3]